MVAKTPAIELTSEDRTELERRSRSQTMACRDVIRAKIILTLAAGGTIKGTARALSVERRIVRKWQRRFQEHGLSGLDDLPRPGRAPVFSPGGRNAPCEARVRAA
jgi:hypothetical protein